MKASIIFSIVFALSCQSNATDEFLIKTKSPINDQQARSLNLQKVRADVFVVAKNDLARARNTLQIIDINPNIVIQPDNLPNDLLSDQWGMRGDSSGGGANVIGAWLTTTGSKDVVVAITDTGLDINHPDLAENLWNNTQEINGEPGVDDDGNGFVDDFHGWNVAENSNDLTDRKRHGTHVAGIVGARGNNGTGLVGVSWEVSLMAVPFFHRNKDTKMSDAIKAIDYAVDNGAHIINASWGATHDAEAQDEVTLLSEAIQRAADRNVVFVAAAGNSNYNNDNNGHIPASLNAANVISVGSVTRHGWRSSFSNYGANSVDVFAPGSTIKSTLPGGYYGNLNGTSMAAPFVSGIVALLLAKEPELKVSQIIQRVVESCRANSNLTNSCLCQGHIDADKVLNP